MGIGDWRLEKAVGRTCAMDRTSSRANEEVPWAKPVADWRDLAGNHWQFWIPHSRQPLSPLQCLEATTTAVPDGHDHSRCLMATTTAITGHWCSNQRPTEPESCPPSARCGTPKVISGIRTALSHLDPFCSLLAALFKPGFLFLR